MLVCCCNCFIGENFTVQCLMILMNLMHQSNLIFQRANAETKECVCVCVKAKLFIVI